MQRNFMVPCSAHLLAEGGANITDQIGQHSLWDILRPRVQDGDQVAVEAFLQVALLLEDAPSTFKDAPPKIKN